MPLRQYFIGLTFYPNVLVSGQMLAFRQRFDSKYNCSPELIMSLLPPFYLQTQKIGEVVADAIDILETHFIGPNEADHIDFVALDFINSKKKGTLLLRPDSSFDLFHGQEALADQLMTNGANFKKAQSLDKSTKKELKKSFFNLALPLARGCDEEHLQVAIATAKEQLQFPLTFKIKNICWFEKMPGHWPVKKILFTFAHDQGQIFSPGSLKEG